MFVHALRQALCPSPGLRALADAAARGRLRALSDEPRRRLSQRARLRELLRDWILG